MASKLQSTINTDDINNECCIWDPSPMCLGSGAYQLLSDRVTEDNPRAWDRKRNATEISNPDNIFTKSEGCKRWYPYQRHPGQGIEDPETGDLLTPNDGVKFAQKKIPRYGADGTQFRFLVISAGPTGSGKTAVVDNIKGQGGLARRINKNATDKPWIILGHDINIKNDEDFKTKYRELENSFPPNIKSDTDNQIRNRYALEVKNLYNNTKKRKDPNNVDEGDGEPRDIKEDKAIQFAYIYIQYIQSSESLITKIPQKSELQEIIGETIAYDTYLYFQVCIAFHLGLNINYETTLRSTQSIKFLAKIADIFTDHCDKYNYIIILGFPIVPYNELESRIKTRFDNRTEENIEFIDPIIGCNLLDSMHRSYLTVAGLIENCTGPGNWRETRPCEDIGIDYLILFDNSKNENKVQKLYDTIPISSRSYILLSESYQNQATALQTPQKKMLIAVLMNNLNCLERAVEMKDDESCTGNYCEAKSSCLALSPRSKKGSNICSMEIAPLTKEFESLHRRAEILRRHNELLSMRKKNGGKRKTKRAKKKKGRQTRRKRKK